MATKPAEGIIGSAIETVKDAAGSVADSVGSSVRAVAAALGRDKSAARPDNPHAPRNARARRIAARLAKRAEKKTARA